MKKIIFLFLLFVISLNLLSQRMGAFKDESGKYGFKKLSYDAYWEDFILGEVLLAPKYDSVAFYEVYYKNSDHTYLKNDVEGFYCVRKNGKWGYIDSTGKEITPLKYDKVFPFHQGRAKVKMNDKMGLVNQFGKEVIPCEFDDLINETCNEGLVRVSVNDKWGYFDTLGHKITPFSFLSARAFSEGLACVKTENGYGFIDKTGKLVIEELYYGSIGDFHEGLAFVGRGTENYNDLGEVFFEKNHAFIDRSGKLAIRIPEDYNIEFSPYFEYPKFKDGKLKVKSEKEGRYFYIDKTGNEVK